HLVCDFDIDDNYFAWQALSRTYDTDAMHALPEYLKEENFDMLRDRVTRASTTIASVTDVLRDQPRGTFNRFVLLDAQDWMDAATITALWREVVDRGERGSRIIFRTAGADSPLPHKLPNEILDRIEYREDVSRELWQCDRASIYGGFHLYVLK